MVQFTDVFKEYENGVKALKGVSFNVRDGEFVFLVGPSGSGKSTIIKLITGEIAPTDGQVIVNDFDLNRMRLSRLPYLRRSLEGWSLARLAILPRKAVRPAAQRPGA